MYILYILYIIYILYICVYIYTRTRVGPFIWSHAHVGLMCYGKGFVSSTTEMTTETTTTTDISPVNLPLGSGGYDVRPHAAYATPRDRPILIDFIMKPTRVRDLHVYVYIQNI